MIKGFKFGILYAKEGQTKEDEMFANGTPLSVHLPGARDDSSRLPSSRGNKS